MLTIPIKLDATPDGLCKEIRIKQYASDFKIVATLVTTTGEITIEGGTSVYLRGTKRDGKGWQLGGTRTENTVTFSGTHEQMQQMTAVAGKQKFEAVLIHDGKELPFASFILDVQRAAMDAETVNPSQIDELRGQVIETNTIYYRGGLRVEDGVLIIGGGDNA